VLTDSEYAKNHRGSRARAVAAETNKRWSDRQKIECVTTFIALGGSVALTSATLRIPEQTIFVWKRSEWWNDMVNEIKQEGRLVLSQRLKKIVEKTLVVVEDRVVNGDFIYDQKKGELVRKPVSMKDAAKVANDTIILSEKLEVNENFTVDGNQIEDKLAKLAKAFQDLAKGIVHQPEPEDIEFVEQIDEEEINEDCLVDKSEDPGEAPIL
jgi:hypothetical protein